MESIVLLLLTSNIEQYSEGKKKHVNLFLTDSGNCKKSVITISIMRELWDTISIHLFQNCDPLHRCVFTLVLSRR